MTIDDNTQAKAFVAKAERIMLWGGLEYHAKRLYNNIISLAEQAEDSGEQFDLDFGLDIRRLDFGKFYTEHGQGLNGMYNVFSGANAYLTERLENVIDDCDECDEEDYKMSDTCIISDVTHELKSGILRYAMKRFVLLCERFGEINQADGSYDNWHNITMSIKINGGTWTSDTTPIHNLSGVVGLFEKMTDIID